MTQARHLLETSGGCAVPPHALAALCAGLEALIDAQHAAVRAQELVAEHRAAGRLVPRERVTVAAGGVCHPGIGLLRIVPDPAARQ